MTTNRITQNLSKKQKLLFFGSIIAATILILTAIFILLTDKNPENNNLSKTYSEGDIIFYNGLQLKVNTVSYSPRSMYNSPRPGYEFVIINVTITNKSHSPERYSSYDFKLTADGEESNLNIVYLDYNVDLLPLGMLLDGDSVTGDIVSRTKKDTKSLKLTYKPDLFNGKSVTIKLK
ncbi:DUF4352 domain-containing protein [Listeria monocytogenes]|nr:DUF4352 domain-containing protein [Listeria monocytogenes]EKZ3787260.1 DUF4352 domain-containing protein [Listeria monocytogenes]